MPFCKSELVAKIGKKNAIGKLHVTPVEDSNRLEKSGVNFLKYQILSQVWNYYKIKQ